MDESVAPARMESQKPLTKWVDEMRDVLKVITAEISEESARQRAATEIAQREFTKVCEVVAGLRTEMERANGLAATAQQERDALREEVGRLRAENDQQQLERAEAAEAAGKLLEEMKELVTEVVNRFHGPPRTSPFARETKGIAQLTGGHMTPEVSSSAVRQSDESHGGTLRPVDK
jgi:chromosome segregation ATPase